MKRFKLLSVSIALMLPILINGQCVQNYAGNSGLSGLNNTAVWVNMPNAQGAPDGNVVDMFSLVPMLPGMSTSRLAVWDFGLDIPCNATIDNVSFTITRRNNAAAGEILDENILLRFGDFSLAPVNAATATPWLNSTTAFETVLYSPVGGWGTSITADDINDNLLGFTFTVLNNSTTETGFPEIDAIEIDVCYTVIGAPSPQIQATVTTTADNLCDPLGNGTVVINATGGTGIFEYSNDGGATWQASNTFNALFSDTYSLQVRNSDMSCSLDVGAAYVGCMDGAILQVGDAIYTCKPSSPDFVTLAIDRVQPLHDLYTAGNVYDDVSGELQRQAMTWTAAQLGGEVYGVTLDASNNIYTGTSTLYNVITPIASADLLAIDGVTGVPSVIATLPGNAGISQLEFQEGCGQLFVVNLEDGIIYRYSTAGTLLSTFDPMGADDGLLGLAPLGERLIAVAYNNNEDRLYYSVWSNDMIDNGTRNTVRSVAIDPVTCDFLPLTDQEEVVLPFISETDTRSFDYSMPIGDIEFDEAGAVMLIAEVGFNSTIPLTQPHRARVLNYAGMSSAWTLDNAPPVGNTNYKYEIGDEGPGTNSRGGVDFAYAGIGTSGCVDGQGTFIISTGDALKGVDCASIGCVYGFQYFPIDGANPSNSVLVDLPRQPDSQQKGFFGDVDVVNGCCPCACPSITLDITTTDNNLCQGDLSTLCTSSEAGGTGPYTHAWSTAETTNCIDVMPTATTTYSVTITDTNNCTGENSVAIAVSPTVTIDNVQGAGSTDCTNPNGSITIMASGGVPPFQYSIDNGMTFTTNNVITDLGAGTYNVVLQDAFTCMVSYGAITLPGPPTMVIGNIALVDNTNCALPNGSITITASGGTGALSYSIDGGITFDPSNVFNNLRGGDYDVVIQDAGSCTTASTVTLNDPVAQTVTIMETPDTDCVGDNGEITITATGGAMPIMYSMDGGVTFVSTNVFSNLGAGIYSVIVSDANSCTVANTVEILADPCGGSVGDRIWEDINGNGAQDIGEPGVPDLRVELINSFGNVVGIQISDATGGFLFENVTAGDYFIRYKQLGDFIPTFSNASGNAETDSDVDNSNGPNTTPLFTLSSGEFDLSRDFGVYRCVQIGELVWFDLDEDGIQDTNENGINGLKVELYRNSNNLWIKTEVDYTGHKPGTGSDDGYYKFCAAPGSYYLKYINAPDRLVRTLSDRGNNDSRDSDVTDQYGPGTTDQFTVSSGDEKCDVAAGFVPAGTIGDFVWIDENRDGSRGIAEQGLAGVKVQAINVAGEMIAHATTDKDGRYMLDLLPQDEYYVHFILHDDYVITAPHQGQDENLDSDVDDSNGPNTTGVYSVRPGKHVESVDAGVMLAGLPVTWLDINGEATEEGNLITWEVASEFTVSHYELEYKGADDSEFVMINKEQSEYGTYQGYLSYSLLHEDFDKGINYYRIKQIDLDGRYDYSDVVSVKNAEAGTKEHDIKIFPNPVLAELNIGINLFQDSEEITVNLHDNLGRLVADNLILDVNQGKGYKLYSVDVSTIPQGVYSLEIIVDKTVAIRKIAITD